MMVKKEARFLGFDLSTTALAVGVTDVNGQNEDFVSIPMQGATKWRNQPAFDLSHLPVMMNDVLHKLAQKGWVFGPKKGHFSFSVRQHDLVLLDKNDSVLIPALSWQCTVAKKKTNELINQGAEAIVGRIEPRFILPKLLWALRQDETIESKIKRVMTTGDYISYMLTGLARLSTSDALSNGLLDQATKKLAGETLNKAGLETKWFPSVIQSGEVIGTVSEAKSESWRPVNVCLEGWHAVASLGDNHAGAVGCGLEKRDTIVVSGGSSGTITRLSDQKWKLRNKAACFEFYKQRLLLMMLADCGVWQDRFFEKFCAEYKLAMLDQSAYKADFTSLKRIRQGKTPEGWIEEYPNGFKALGLAEKVASTQASIVLELLILVNKMLNEVVTSDSPQIVRLVLTGSLSRSKFFRHAFWIGLRSFAPGITLYINSHKGPLISKPAALGALINAIPKEDVNNQHIIAEFCSTAKEDEPSFDISGQNALRSFFQSNLP